MCDDIFVLFVASTLMYGGAVRAGCLGARTSSGGGAVGFCADFYVVLVGVSVETCSSRVGAQEWYFSTFSDQKFFFGQISLFVYMFFGQNF